jgi:hypothetical protein
VSFANDCLDSIGVCPNRIQSLAVGQCTAGEVCLELKDPATGLAIDLTAYGITASSSSSSSSSSSGEPVKHGVEFLIKELPSSPIIFFRKMGVVKTSEDAVAGKVCLNYDDVDSSKAGIWCGMAVIWQQGVQRKLFPFYFEVTPNLLAYNPSGPLSVAEIRLSIRDTCPEINFLIDAVEYKDEEIAWAMRRPIEYWNEIPPDLGFYTPMDFPFRYHWLEATVGELLRMAAIWLRRNDLDYTAAGLTVADTKKWPDYMRMAEQRSGEWKGFVKTKKLEMNIDGGYASMGGYPYPYSRG